MHAKYNLLKQHFEEIVSLTNEEWDFIQSHFEYKSLKKTPIFNPNRTICRF